MSFGSIVRRRRAQLGLTQDQLAPRAGISKPYLSNIETGKAKNPPSDGVLKALEQALGFEPGELAGIAHLARTPVDVRQSHELLEAEVQQLRSVVKELLANAPRMEIGGEDLGQLVARLRQKSNVTQLPAGVVVPIINTVAAGYPHNFRDLDYPPSVADEYIRCPDLHDAQAFAARVVDDSMEPRYHEGDIVVFSPASHARSGDDCFVRFAGAGATTFRRFYQDDAETIRLQPVNSKYAGATHGRQEVAGLWPAVFRMEKLRES
jgi:SOS-response transcriptional repressor LexA